MPTDERKLTSENVQSASLSARQLRFGHFSVDLVTREVRKHGARIRVHGASFQVLAALLERPGDLVTREELRSRLWPDGTFVDYDNSLNSTVNRLREALNDSAETPRYIETLPRLGYRFVGQVTSEPAPTGPASETPARDLSATTAEESSPVVEGSRLGTSRAASAAVAVVLLVVATMFWFSRPSAQPRMPSSVLVVPFQVSPPAGQPTLGLVVAEDLAAQLSAAGFEIMPRSASFRYAERGAADLRGVPGETIIISGGISQQGSGILVHAQVRLPGGDVSRSLSSSTNPENLLSATEEIARRIHRELRPQAASASNLAKRPTQNLSAYENYVEGLRQLELRSAVGVTRATDALELAIRKDPTFAAAHATIAKAYAFDYVNYTKAESAAKRALELDSRMSEAHTVLGFTRLFWRHDWSGAQAEFQTAIDLDPRNATAHHWYALHLAAQGLMAQAKAEIDKAVAIDPYSPAIRSDLGHILLYADRPAEAVSACKPIVREHPAFLDAQKCLHRSFRITGQHREAAEVLAEAKKQLGQQLLFTGGSYDEAEQAALDGNIPAALRSLEQAFERKDLNIVFIRANPAFRTLHREPAYLRLLAKVGVDKGFHPYQRREP